MLQDLMLTGVIRSEHQWKVAVEQPQEVGEIPYAGIDVIAGIKWIVSGEACRGGGH